MAEQWKQISHHPLYDVSNMGNVRSWNNMRGGRKKKNPKVLKLPIGNHGYPVVKLYDGGGRSTSEDWLVHRLVLEAFVGECHEHMECCHGNGIRKDARLENLRWGTRAENKHDSVLHGTACGQRGKSLLTTEMVQRIRDMYKTGQYAQHEIASVFGIGQDHVCRIVNYKARVHA